MAVAGRGPTLKRLAVSKLVHHLIFHRDSDQMDQAVMLSSEIRNKSRGRSVSGSLFHGKVGSHEPQIHRFGTHLQRKREGWDTHFALMPVLGDTISSFPCYSGEKLTFIAACPLVDRAVRFRTLWARHPGA